MRKLEFIQFFLSIMFLNCVILISEALIIKPKQPDITALSDILIHILKFCNNDYETVVINDGTNESIIESIRSLETITVILNNSSMVDQKLLYKNKIDSFIVTFDDSMDHLVEILHSFKKSPWWNVMTPYFVLSTSRIGCHAQSVFEPIWKMNILTCYFICLDPKNEPLIYTFNPYSSRAPDQWKIVQETTTEFNYMAIYSRPYEKENTCKSFNFDRTKYLDKATMRITCLIYTEKRDLIDTAEDKSKLFKLNDFDLLTIKSLKRLLNISIKFDYDFSDKSDVKYQSALNRLVNKTTDFMIFPLPYVFVYNYSLVPTYPIAIFRGAIFSQNRGFFTPLEKMYNFYGILIILATITISILTYLVFWYIRKPRSSAFAAALDVVRLWVATTIYSKINTAALRIFFSVIILYFLILQATFQGRIAQFLMKPKLRDHPETLSDLLDPSYKKIFVTPHLTNLFDDYKELQAKIKITEDTECMQAVLNSKSSVCIETWEIFLFLLHDKNFSNKQEKNYYISKSSLEYEAVAYPIRLDWPLRERIDLFFMTLDHSLLMLRKVLAFNLAVEKTFILSEPHYDWEPINFQSISFIFYFLLIGIICGIYSFILEKRRAQIFEKDNFKVTNRKKTRQNRKMTHRNRKIEENIIVV